MPVLILGVAQTQVQDLALCLVELHEVCTGSPLKPAKVPLDGIPSLQHVDRTTQLGVGKLAEGAVNPMSLPKEQRASQSELPVLHIAFETNSSLFT